MGSEVIYTSRFHRKTIPKPQAISRTSLRDSLLLRKDDFKETDRTRSFNFASRLASSQGNRNDRTIPVQVFVPQRSSTSASINRLELTLKLDHLSKNRREKASKPCNTSNTSVYLSCSTRVASALKHTEQQHDLCFYRGVLRRWCFGRNGSKAKVYEARSNLARTNTAQNYGASGAENSDYEFVSYSCGTSELPSQESDENSETGSISLVPGVFARDRHPPTRVFVKYRQLSTDEWVLEWLFKYCTHPSQTLPLL